ncbi:MAG: hypothetical protein R3F11_11310 [Verrucomicrobiales bacterium]
MQGASLLPVFADPAAEVRKAAFSEHNWHDYEAHGKSSVRRWRLSPMPGIPARRSPGRGKQIPIRSPSHQSLLKLRDSGGSGGQADVLLARAPARRTLRLRSRSGSTQQPRRQSAFAGRKAALAKLLDRWIEDTRRFRAPRNSRQIALTARTPLGGKIPAGTSPGSIRGADKINAPVLGDRGPIPPRRRADAK